MSENDFKNYDEIYSIVKQIPKGKVTSYGTVAKLIGTGFSARVVGYAMSKVGNLKDVPTHRVVNRNGLLTGRHHFNPPELMQTLLEKEGLEIKNNQVVNFKKNIWNPLEDDNFL